MLNNDLTRTDFHFKIIKFYLFALLFEISSMIFIPKYVYIRWKKKKKKTTRNELFAFVTEIRCPPRRGGSMPPLST